MILSDLLTALQHADYSAFVDTAFWGVIDDIYRANSVIININGENHIFKNVCLLYDNIIDEIRASLSSEALNKKIRLVGIYNYNRRCICYLEDDSYYLIALDPTCA